MSFSLNATTGVITQSGTDTDLSGLSSITGVTVYDDDPTRGKVTYDMGDLRLDIDGTLSHDPDRELMIFHHEKSSSSNSVSEPVLTISGGGTYNYGVKTTTSDGKVGYSTGCGLMITGRGYSNWHPSDNAINIGSNNANFVCRGGVVECSRGLYFGGNVDIEETVFLNASSRFSLEIRVFGSGTISTDRAQNIVLAGGISVMDAYRMTEQKIVFREGAISRVFGSYYEAELFDFDVSKNVFNYDIGNCANTGQSIQDHHIVNSATGSDVRSMWRNTTGNASQMGNTFIHKEVSFNIKDTSANGIEGVKLYLQDNPSNFAKSISVTTTNGAHTYPTPTLSTAVVSNAGKTISYDYTGAIEYEKTTDVNGDIAKFRVLTATQFLEYTADDSSATQYFNTFSGGKWKEADGQAPKYSDWDTNRFGNFYKVDRRSDSNSNADDFTFKFCSYGHMLSSTTQPLKGLGELEVDWVLFDDALITDTYASAKALTEITDANKFYDRAKAYLVDNFAGETETIVTRDGNTINARGYDVVVDDQATDVFAFNGTTITIKASSFVGNIQTTGTITLNNSAEVIGSYGSNTVLPWEVTNVEATAQLQLYNMTKSLEVENLVVTGTAGNKVTSSGTYTGSEVSVGDNIRLRITCQAGTNAFLPYEAFGIATSVGISFEANQVADTIYNDNGINADNLTTLSADYPNVQIDISDGDGIADAKEFYAFYVKQTTTSTGIEKWFGAITAIDHMNYRVNTSVADIKLQNTGSTPLVISGARIFRDNGTSILHADVGDQPMTQDNGELIQYIKGQVDDSLNNQLPPAVANAINSNSTITGIDKNSKLIPALL
jgi:hypothetical protein